MLKRGGQAIATVAFILAAAGCAQPSRVVSDVEWAQAVAVSRDDFKLQTVTRGAPIEKPGSTTFLRATQRDTLPGIEEIVIYVVVKGNEWKFIEQAFVLSVGEIRAERLDREIRYCNRYGCALAEHIAMPTSRQFLRRYIDNGVDIKLTGKRGEEQVFLPPAYIAAFLASLPVVPQR